jgi:hypothetical protein
MKYEASPIPRYNQVRSFVPNPMALSQSFVLFTLVLAAGISGVSIAQERMPTPQLSAVFPPGGKPGTTVELSATGNDLDEADKLLLTHPGITAAVKVSTPTDFEKVARPLYGNFTVTIAGDVPPGIYEARTIGRFGVSNPRSFVVGSLNEVIDSAGNESADKPMEIAVGTTVSGRVNANSYDYYKLPLKAGERVLIDCWAQRIDSRMDPTVVVLNAAGREIARVRDTVGNDPVLDFTAPAEGIYTLKLSDGVYGGGPDYVYRLTVASTPFIDFVFPPSAAPGSNGPFTLYGVNLPGGQPADGMTMQGSPLQKLVVNIAAPGDEAAKTQLAVGLLGRTQRAWQDGFEYRLAAPQGSSNPVTVYFARAGVVPETEPNSLAAEAQKLTLPCEIVGQFYPAGDNDYYQFDAKKGEVYWIEVASHQLGIDADPFLTISRITKNEKGEEQIAEIAQVDDPQERQNRIGSDFDTSNDDPSYKFTAPEDGSYRVLVRDQFGTARRDPSIVYRLSMTRAQADFRLVATTDPPRMGDPNNQPQIAVAPLLLKKGGTVLVPIKVERRHGYEGDITISADGLPAGVTAAPAVIGGNVESASLVLSAAENVTAALAPIRIVGKATIDGKEVAREARYCQTVWGTQNRQQQLPEFRLTQTLQLGIVDREMQAATILPAEDKIYETSVGGNVEVPVNVARRGEFKEAIKLSGGGLPNEIRFPDVNVDGAAAQAKVAIPLNQQNIKPGMYTFYLKGETKQKYVRNAEAIPAVEADQKQFEETQKAIQQTAQTAEQTRNQANQKAQESQTATAQATQNKQTATTEQQQKAAALKAATDKLNAAKEAAAKDEANQALKDALALATKELEVATAQAKEADDKLAVADKALTDAQANQKTAEEAKVKGEADLKAAQDKVAQANQFKQQLDQRVNQVRQQNQPKDIPFIVVSTPIKLRIAKAPHTATVGAPLAIKQNEKQPLTVTLARLYGYDQPLEVIFEPQGVAGISGNNQNVPNGQNEGKLEVTAAANAPVGEHVCNVKVRARWNNVQSEVNVPVTIKIEAAAVAK